MEGFGFIMALVIVNDAMMDVLDEVELDVDKIDDDDLI